MKNILKYGLAVGLASGLMYWVFKDIDLATTILNFKQANYFLVFVAFVFGLMAHISRAFRWKLMMEPMGYKPSLLNTTVAVLIGYFTNLILPRAGEFARSASLQKSDDIPFEKSFGAVIAERVVDVFVAMLLVVINVLLEFDRIKDFAAEMLGERLKNSGQLLTFGILALLIGLIGVWLIYKNYERLMQNTVIQKISKIIIGLWSGFSSVLKIKKSGQFFLHTVLIWLLYYLATYVLCMAVPIGSHLNAIAIFTILVMGSLGMAAPTIGGIGAYHALVGKIVTLYGLNAEQGTNLAFFLHSMNSILFLLVYGGFAFIISFLTQKSVKHEK